MQMMKRERQKEKKKRIRVLCGFFFRMLFVVVFWLFFWWLFFFGWPIFQRAPKANQSQCPAASSVHDTTHHVTIRPSTEGLYYPEGFSVGDRTPRSSCVKLRVIPRTTRPSAQFQLRVETRWLRNRRRIFNYNTWSFLRYIGNVCKAARYNVPCSYSTFNANHRYDRDSRQTVILAIIPYSASSNTVHCTNAYTNKLWEKK